MVEKVTELPEDFDEQVTEAFEVWLERVPDSDEPFIISHSGTLSARQLVDEVARRTPFGLEQLEACRHFAIAQPAVGPRGVLQMLRGDWPPSRQAPQSPIPPLSPDTPK